jgi:hypothetical protein
VDELGQELRFAGAGGADHELVTALLLVGNADHAACEEGGEKLA